MANTTVMNVNMECYKCKRVALQSVTRIDGIDSISISMKDNTIKVVGDADPVNIVSELRRKFKCAYLVSSGPTPPPPKKEEPKKEEAKKEEPKKEEAKKEEPKKEEAKKEEPKKEEAKKEEKKEEAKKEEKKEEEKPKENPPQQQIVYYPSYPPHYPGKPVECCRCSDCSNRSDIMWPRYHPPKAPQEVWYVWNEENQSSCTIS